MVQPDNKVIVAFKTAYRHDGTGLHHFKDAEANEEYLYTQHEAFNCHRSFPCFDQPDMRGVLSLVTFAPEGWVSICNGLPLKSVNKEDAGFAAAIAEVVHGSDFAATYDDNCVATFFKDTPRITPYLFAFCVGPYVELK